jgi:hypothetical protein
MSTEPIETTPVPNEEEPQVFSVARDVNGTHFNRRNFIEKAALTTAAVTVISSGCTLPIPGLGGNVDVQATVDSAMSATENARKVTEMALKEQQQAQVQAEATQAQPDTPIPTRTPRPTKTETPIPATPTLENTATPTGINATIKGDNVNFRSGPGTSYTPITRLPMGSRITIVGRLDDSSWVAIALSDPKKQGSFVHGWIKTNLINVNMADVKALPVIKDIPPTPTPMPGRYGKTGAGQKGMDYTFTDEYGNIYDYNLPCGSSLPLGADCTCNCVTVPTLCACVDNSGCNPIHYWYPN